MISDPQPTKSPKQAEQELRDRLRQLNKMKMRMLKRLGPQSKVLKKVDASVRNTPAAREARKVFKLALPNPYFVDQEAKVRVPKSKAQRKARRRLAR